MRRAGEEARLHGRLIPIPRQLSAGCGLAWSEPAANEDALRSLIVTRGLEYEQISFLEL